MEAPISVIVSLSPSPSGHTPLVELSSPLRQSALTRKAGTPHFLLPITSSPAPSALGETFTALLSRNPDSYKPIPVIHSLTLGAGLSWPASTASMTEWLGLADAPAASRNVPFLWLGPVAAGHRKPPGQILGQGNNALWHFTAEMAKEARNREMDALGLYNMSLQASSWDGSAYGEKVALVQAMMVSVPTCDPPRPPVGLA